MAHLVVSAEAIAVLAHARHVVVGHAEHLFQARGQHEPLQAQVMVVVAAGGIGERAHTGKSLVGGLKLVGKLGECIHSICESGASRFELRGALLLLLGAPLDCLNPLFGGVHTRVANVFGSGICALFPATRIAQI